ncbi:DUF6879 family protein [Pseudonocardia sp. CA-107938]|uniref:DUF6879 family protein n=1 Tax=Pseudonocardia sp. CA-107938 TaxID=3240021 RepID=UPI003D946B56
MTDRPWLRYFDEFEHTAFRLEVRDRYNEPEEQADFQRFLAGEPVRLDWRQDWLTMIRNGVRAGKTFRRVRVVSEPLTDYSRFGVMFAGQSNAAGDDIRYLGRGEAEALGLPNHDYWLFDSHILVKLHFGDDDLLLDGEVVTDPKEIVDANRWRDIAWHHAWLRETFVTQ